MCKTVAVDSCTVKLSSAIRWNYIVSVNRHHLQAPGRISPNVSEDTKFLESHEDSLTWLVIKFTFAKHWKSLLLMQEKNLIDPGRDDIAEKLKLEISSFSTAVQSKKK